MGAQVADALGFLGVAHAGDRPVSEYWVAMIFRLELARAMLHHPTDLCLNEPTVGLDPTARMTVWQDVPELREGKGTTIARDRLGRVRPTSCATEPW